MKTPRKFVFLSCAAALCCAALVTACSGDGGDTSNVIEGNVMEESLAANSSGITTVAKSAAVRPTLLARLRAVNFIDNAYAAVGGVRVSIRETDLSTVTDETGYFRLEGDFDGEVTLDFELPDRQAIALRVMTARGNRTTLQNIRFDRTSNTASVEQTSVSSLSSGVRSGNDADGNNFVRPGSQQGN